MYAWNEVYKIIGRAGVMKFREAAANEFLGSCLIFRVIQEVMGIEGTAEKLSA